MSSLGSSSSVEKSISEARSERCLWTRSSTIEGMAKIFLRAGSFCTASSAPGWSRESVKLQLRRVRRAATWLNGPDADLAALYDQSPDSHAYAASRSCGMMSAPSSSRRSGTADGFHDVRPSQPSTSRVPTRPRDVVVEVPRRGTLYHREHDGPLFPGDGEPSSRLETESPADRLGDEGLAVRR